jgi:acetoin utilization protein AcuC
MRSAFIYSKEFANFKAYKGHPWLFERSEVVYQLCTRLHLLDYEWMSIYDPKPADTEELLRFHTRKYIDLLKTANHGVSQRQWLWYGLGTTESPVFKGVYDYHALAAGATLLGSELIDEGKANIVFSPTGGFHHAGKDFASGFCYINDIVLVIKKWLRRRKRVFYIDIDAHHGDQVQEAFYSTSKVMTVPGLKMKSDAEAQKDIQSMFPCRKIPLMKNSYGPLIRFSYPRSKPFTPTWWWQCSVLMSCFQIPFPTCS